VLVGCIGGFWPKSAKESDQEQDMLEMQCAVNSLIRKRLEENADLREVNEKLDKLMQEIELLRYNRL